MLRRACLALLVATAIGQSQPPSPRPTKSTQEQQRERRNEQGGQQSSQPGVSVSIDNSRYPEQHDKTPTSADWWIAAFTAVLAATAVLQYFIYRKQTQVMTDALRETAKAASAAESAATTAAASLEVSKRAVVVVDSVYLVPELPNSPALLPETYLNRTPQFSIKNAGETEALDCHIVTSAALVPRGIGEEVKCPDPISTIPTVIHRGKEFGHSMATIQNLFGMSLAPREIVELVQRGFRLRINARIEYRDIFGKKWKTETVSILGDNRKFTTQMEINEVKTT